MARTHYFYFPISVSNLNQIVKAHQLEFDALIEDTFSENEVIQFEKWLDTIAAIYVQPIISELSFDDFYPDPVQMEKQKVFFESCASSICLENLPYFEGHPFQVSYLKMLLSRFDEVLVDQGGVSELVFKETYLSELQKFKDIDTLIVNNASKTITPKTSGRPVNPIDFLALDVYKELERLKGSFDKIEFSSPKVQKIFSVMKDEILDAETILVKSGLIPKDFEDSLERLKFTLKKML